MLALALALAHTHFELGEIRSVIYFWLLFCLISVADDADDDTAAAASGFVVIFAFVVTTHTILSLARSFSFSILIIINIFCFSSVFSVLEFFHFGFKCANGLDAVCERPLLLAVLFVLCAFLMRYLNGTNP